MTREEAITLIKSAQLMLINPTTNEPISDLHMALEMAIQALSQVTEVRKLIVDGSGYDVYEDCKAVIDELPSVTHKSGKWIRWREEVQRGTHCTENIPHCKCSECDTEYDIFASRFINYCPNCGAKMESEVNNG